MASLAGQDRRLLPSRVSPQPGLPRASVQTGEPPNLARKGDPIGLTAEAGGFARPNHGLTTVVTGHGLRYPVEISENSRKNDLICPQESPGLVTY